MARLNLTENNRPETYRHSVKSGESTATIPLGTPVVLNLSSAPQPTTAQDGFGAGFQDGLQVVLPSTAGANPTVLFNYGVATGPISPGQLGEVAIHGVTAYGLFLRATRASSTSSWTSSASSSSAGGFLLSIDTVNNCYASMANSSIALGTASSIVSTAGFQPGAVFNAVLLDSLASFSASASATTDSRTAMLTLQRVFVRQM